MFMFDDEEKEKEGDGNLSDDALDEVMEEEGEDEEDGFNQSEEGDEYRERDWA